MTGIVVTETIAAPPETVFARSTDLARWPETCEAITKVEILTDGPVGVGTRFRETRKMWGKEATEEMEITAFEPPNRYVLGAESHGCKYRTELRFDAQGDGTLVTFDFQGEPQTLTAKVMGFVMKPMMKSMIKMCAKDLADMKAAIESES